MVEAEVWENQKYFKELIQQKIAIERASISFLDVKNNLDQREVEIDPKFVILTERTYELLKRYVDLIQSQDDLCKSFDDRILDLLANEGNITSSRRIIPQLKRTVKDLEYTPDHRHLYLRDITKQKLLFYCYFSNIENYNKGIYKLIENALKVMTINNLRREYEEVIQ